MTEPMAPAAHDPEPLLQLHDLHVFYGNIEALKGVTLHVNAGEIVTLIGSNGAGKSTTLRAISGTHKPRVGTVRLGGTEIQALPAHEVVKLGVAHAPEGRRVFSRMSVYENLQMGAFSRRGASIEEDVARVYDLFPRLRERRTQKAGTMSGGEQQMLAIGRALMARPRVLLLDEPSMGLSPSRSSASSPTSTARGRRCCWWSRMRSWRSMSRTADTSSRPARSSSPTRRGTSPPTSRCDRPTWARSDARGAGPAMTPPPRPPRDYRPDLRPMLILVAILVLVVVGWLSAAGLMALGALDQALTVAKV
jgi:branched-chain amino acid transport system ATP-binding protein